MDWSCNQDNEFTCQLILINLNLPYPQFMSTLPDTNLMVAMKKFEKVISSNYMRIECTAWCNVKTRWKIMFLTISINFEIPGSQFCMDDLVTLFCVNQRKIAKSCGCGTHLHILVIANLNNGKLYRSSPSPLRIWILLCF